MGAVPSPTLEIFMSLFPSLTRSSFSRRPHLLCGNQLTIIVSRELWVMASSQLNLLVEALSRILPGRAAPLTIVETIAGAVALSQFPTGRAPVNSLAFHNPFNTPGLSGFHQRLLFSGQRSTSLGLLHGSGRRGSSSVPAQRTEAGPE